MAQDGGEEDSCYVHHSRGQDDTKKNKRQCARKVYGIMRQMQVIPRVASATTTSTWINRSTAVVSTSVFLGESVLRHFVFVS